MASPCCVSKSKLLAMPAILPSTAVQSTGPTFTEILREQRELRETVEREKAGAFPWWWLLAAFGVGVVLSERERR